MYAHTIDAAMEDRITTGRRINPGRVSRPVAAAAASIIPTLYWPSTPMLKRPALKATATARPEKINGVAVSRTRARSESSEVE
jgi:hypothetical protein